MSLGTISAGVDRVIIGYERLDLGAPVQGVYVNTRYSYTFTSLVPGAKYRVTVWGLGRGSYKRRTPSPTVRVVTTMEQSKSVY